MQLLTTPVETPRMRKINLKDGPTSCAGAGVECGANQRRAFKVVLIYSATLLSLLLVGERDRYCPFLLSLQHFTHATGIPRLRPIYRHLLIGPYTHFTNYLFLSHSVYCE